MELKRRLSYREGGRCVQGTLKRHLLSASASPGRPHRSRAGGRRGPGPPR
jgi:hypothetical protein